MIALRDVFAYEADPVGREQGEFSAKISNLRCGRKLKSYEVYDEAMQSILSAPRDACD